MRNRLYPQPDNTLTWRQRTLNTLFDHRDGREAVFLSGAFSALKEIKDFTEVPKWLAWRYARWCENMGVPHEQTSDEAWAAWNAEREQET